MNATISLMVNFAKILFWTGNALIYVVAFFFGAYLIHGWYSNGFGWIQDTLSPFNVRYYLAIFIALAPGIGLRMLSERLADKNRRDKEL